MDEEKRTSAVIFGAGSVGRGFLGQLFCESGHEVVFVDVDEPLVQALGEKGAYTLRLAGVESTQDITVGPVRAIDGRDLEAVATVVAGAQLAATAVGARALPIIARPIAMGLEQRWRSGNERPLNVIICENLHDAPELLSGYVREALPEQWRSRLDALVGFVPAVIARMAPVPTPEQRAADITLIVAEPYKVLPVDRDAFVGRIPQVVGMAPVTPFSAYVERKLYIHNASHAMLGYLGYRRGWEYGYEALVDPEVRRRLESAVDESARALVAEHGLDLDELREHVRDLLNRFGNRALADPIDRLARDPLRKLAPQDRLVGAARLAEKHGIAPDGLAWGIAAALAYDNPADEHAVELQRRISDRGVISTLADVCGISEDESLAEAVLERYEQLQKASTWQDDAQ
ncbi:MAG: mannitol-1-phosphate 5-dehydrogenase [Chloroflexi bacterium]|nr:mannitol-1-phosphate 5-dehydrogenase [Chloroflexota bacterium]